MCSCNYISIICPYLILITISDNYFLQSPFKILLLGADLKHVLRSVAETVDFKGQFQFVLTDSNPHVQARNLILLGILLGEEYHGGDEENSALAFTRASYSLHLDGKTFHKMKKVISDILQGLQPAGKICQWV